MTARMLIPRCRPVILMTGLLLAASAGCHGFAQKHEAKSIPQLGTIDASQPAEMRKVSQSPYVIEPPDELEITTNPPFPTSMTGPFIVQGDGFVDLGLFGEVYVYGLTLSEAEERIAVQMNDSPRALHPESKEKYRVSVRLANNQSKYYYVLGTVANPGRFKAGRQRHGPGRDRASRLETEQPPSEGVSGAASRSGWRRSGLPDRLVRDQGSWRHPDELPGFSRRPSGRPGHEAARVDQELAGELIYSYR